MTGQVSYNIFCRVISSLMQSPKTARLLAEDAECDIHTIRKWVSAMRESGLIYICGWQPHETAHRSAEILSLQKAPFAEKDVLPPTTIRKMGRTRKESRPKKAEVVMPKAATWWGGA